MSNDRWLGLALLPLLLGCGERVPVDPEIVLSAEDEAYGCVLLEERVVCNHGHSLGFRSESLRERRLYLESRGVESPDEAIELATDRDGSLGTGMPDPVTPVLRARSAETVRLRVVSYGDEVHTFHVHGHVWLDESGSPIDNVDMLPAEVHEATFSAGGGPDPGSPERGGPGDWMYHCHVQGHMTSGMWSLLRVMDKGDPDLELETDGRFAFEVPPPLDAPGETVDVWVVAIDVPITIARVYSPAVNDFRAVRRDLWVYVPVTQEAWESADADAIRDGVDPDSFEPWVLSLAQGTRVRVHLANLIEAEEDGQRVDAPVSLHPHGVEYAVEDDGGTPAGVAAGFGDTVDYEYVADFPGIWPYHDHALPHHNVPRGLFASIVVKTPEEIVDLDRDYVVVMHDLDFDLVNAVEDGGAGGHQH